MRLTSESAEEHPDAEVETERVVPHSLRRRRKIVAALKLPTPESVDQLETEMEGVSIQKARILLHTS